MRTVQVSVTTCLCALLISCGEDGGGAGSNSGDATGGSDITSGSGMTGDDGTTGGVGATNGAATTDGVGTTNAVGTTDGAATATTGPSSNATSGTPSGTVGSGTTGSTGSGGATSATDTTGTPSSTGSGGSGGGVTTTGGSGGSGGSATANWKPRVIHTTDLGADPDDEMSTIRALVMADWMDIEGLIVATGCWKKSQSNTSMLDGLVDAYGQVVSNLQAHDPDFPSAEYLRSVSVLGQKGYGMGDVGDGKDSPGSELIIASVDKDDPRPVWATCWGGCNTIAQALWKVQNTRSSGELAEFVSKLRVYDILGQDNAGTWIAKTFPEMIYIRATNVYSWQPSDSWVDQNVQSHGALGAAYPDKAWAYEGDSPAIFHLIPNGLHDPDQVQQSGWGGRFAKKSGIRGMSCMSGEDQAYDPYNMYNEASESISRWKDALQNDFAARMDWSVSSNFDDANHHPGAILNGDTGRSVLTMSAAEGSVQLSAAGSGDPDGDTLSYRWWIDGDASSGSGSISGENSETATVSVSGGAVHVILEVIDNGNPSLTAYRRVIINP